MSTLAELLVIEVENINRATGVAAAAELRRLAQMETEYVSLLKAISDAEPVAWINEEQTIGPNFLKRHLSFGKYVSDNPLHYKHIPSTHSMGSRSHETSTCCCSRRTTYCIWRCSTGERLERVPRDEFVSVLPPNHQPLRLDQAMKDIELPPLLDADVTNNTNLLGYRYSYSAISMQSYARAAVEADGAQRVPEGWKQEAAEAIDWLLNNIRRDAPQLSGKAMGNAVRVRDALLASTPAPAQQEPTQRKLSAVDLAKAATKEQFRHYHEVMAAAHHQEPPQQERKPMTDEEILEGAEALGSGFSSVIGAYFREGVRFAERHHGIFAEPAQGIKE